MGGKSQSQPTSYFERYQPPGQPKSQFQSGMNQQSQFPDLQSDPFRGQTQGPMSLGNQMQGPMSLGYQTQGPMSLGQRLPELTYDARSKNQESAYNGQNNALSLSEQQKALIGDYYDSKRPFGGGVPFDPSKLQESIDQGGVVGPANGFSPYKGPMDNIPMQSPWKQAPTPYSQQGPMRNSPWQAMSSMFSSLAQMSPEQFTSGMDRFGQLYNQYGQPAPAPYHPPVNQNTSWNPQWAMMGQESAINNQMQSEPPQTGGVRPAPPSTGGVRPPPPPRTGGYKPMR